MANVERFNNRIYWCAFCEYSLFSLSNAFFCHYKNNNNSMLNIHFFSVENLSQEKTMANSLDWNDCYYGERCQLNN